MPLYNIADLKVDIDFRYDFAKQRAREYYIGEDTALADIRLKAEDSDFENYIKTFNRDDCLDEFEYVIIGNQFHRSILKFGGIMFHSSCVVADDTAYLFSADSGTGKSTHTALWLKLLGDIAYILNDDKPVIRMTQSGIFVYGTPFSGKTELNKNKKAPIGGICFLERGKKNAIKRIGVSEALPLFLAQTINKVNSDELETLLSVTDGVLGSVDIYKLSCNTDIEAAKVSYSAMSKKEKK